jgi:hypothetical protein
MGGSSPLLPDDSIKVLQIDVLKADILDRS